MPYHTPTDNNEGNNDMREFNVLALDVLGNEIDGFQVNRVLPTEYLVEIDDHATDADIANILIHEGLLCDGVTGDDIDVTGDPEFMLFIDDANTGEMLWQLRYNKQ